jgi:hypothetical protein
MPNPLLLDFPFRPWEIFGGKRALFVRYADVIADLIQDFKLQPIREDMLAPTKRMAGDAKAAPSAEMLQYIDPGIYGGKRFAHLHFRGEVFMLNREQWQTFTGRVKDDLIKRLHAADAISVEQFQDLSDAIDPIG